MSHNKPAQCGSRSLPFSCHEQTPRWEKVFMGSSTNGAQLSPFTMARPRTGFNARQLWQKPVCPGGTPGVRAQPLRGRWYGKLPPRERGLPTSSLEGKSRLGAGALHAAIPKPKPKPCAQTALGFRVSIQIQPMLNRNPVPLKSMPAVWEKLMGQCGERDFLNSGTGRVWGLQCMWEGRPEA